MEPQVVLHLRRFDRAARLQFRTEQNWADGAALSSGFMVVDNSHRFALQLEPDPGERNADDDEGAHRRHVCEIKYTLRNGCSGGSIQQNTVASTFPGLLDGIQPSCDYPDSITTGLEVIDCVLLVNFYAGRTGPP